MQAYFSGWEALNIPLENGQTADWHPLLYPPKESSKYIYNAKFGDFGISKRFIPALHKSDYVASFARAIADLVLSGKTQGLQNCVSDYLTQDEAKELYNFLKPFSQNSKIEKFLKYELTSFYFKDN